jgi:nucleoid-associated protein YgaU
MVKIASPSARAYSSLHVNLVMARGSVRRRVMVGAAIAVLLLGGTTALVLRNRGNTPGGPANPQVAAVSPGGPVDTSKSNPGVSQPPAAVPPSFDVVKVGPDGTAVIAGRAEPGSKVTVRDGDKVIGEVTADRRGEWVLVPEQPIGPGDRLLSLEASNGSGGAAVKSNETVALSIGPSATGGKVGTALAVVLPRDGAGAARVLQRPDGGEASRPDVPTTGKLNSLSMDTAEYDEQGRVVLSGRAPPGARIQIYLGNRPLATATADAAGGWTATSTRAVGAGRLNLRLDQMAEDGRVAQRLTVPLVRPAALQLAPGVPYVVQPGNNLWQIARRAYGVGTRYLIIYSANLAQIRDPERIYPGQVFKVPKS